MKRREMMPIGHDQAQMWQLSTDCSVERMQLQPLQVVGLPKPLTVKIDFDAATTEQLIERLTVLRQQMLPAPPRPAHRH